jgi:hypothetical protein
LDKTTHIVAKSLRAAIHQGSAAPGRKISSLQLASAASYLYITCFPEKESDEEDAGGTRSCTERGLCVVVPVC